MALASLRDPDRGPLPRLEADPQGSPKGAPTLAAEEVCAGNPYICCHHRHHHLGRRVCLAQLWLPVARPGSNVRAAPRSCDFVLSGGRSERDRVCGPGDQVCEGNGRCHQAMAAEMKRVGAGHLSWRFENAGIGADSVAATLVCGPLFTVFGIGAIPFLISTPVNAAPVWETGWGSAPVASHFQTIGAGMHPVGWTLALPFGHSGRRGRENALDREKAWGSDDGFRR
jgi:hypothetical protein